MDLQQVAEELYGGEPEGFTARRAELAAAARAEGDAELAKQVGALRRPTVAAWVVNRLVLGEQGDDVHELVELGDALRAAQAGLDGGRLRELTKQRQQLVTRLVRQARDLADQQGQQLSGAVQRELEETFGAAVADEQAALAVTSGRLTRALAYAGMGEVDVTAATATPLQPRQPRPAKRARARQDDGTAGDRAAAERAAAEDEVAAARAAVETADADVDTAAQARDDAEQAEQEAVDRLDDLQRAVVQARRDLGAAGKAAEAAKREHLRRQQTARDAHAALRKAEQARDRRA